MEATLIRVCHSDLHICVIALTPGDSHGTRGVTVVVVIDEVLGIIAVILGDILPGVTVVTVGIRDLHRISADSHVDLGKIALTVVAVSVRDLRRQGGRLISQTVSLRGIIEVSTTDKGRTASGHVKSVVGTATRLTSAVGGLRLRNVSDLRNHLPPVRKLIFKCQECGVTLVGSMVISPITLGRGNPGLLAGRGMWWMRKPRRLRKHIPLRSL